ncbi:MAG: hypothetical protein RSE41_03350 [Clostridia bacterium]
MRKLIKKTFELVVFKVKINVVITDNFETYITNNKLKQYACPYDYFEDLSDGIGGICFDVDNFDYYILLKPDTTIGYIVHESDHCINKIFKSRGYTLNLDNDELHAYHIGWLSEEIYNFIKEYTQ